MFSDYLIEDDEDAVQELVRSAKRIAVLGIKLDTMRDQPATYVPAYLDSQGLEIIPVPVYYPNVTTILGKPVYRKLVDIPGPIDIVDVFRMSQDVAQHLDDFLAKKPRAVWMQSGIRDDKTAKVLAENGILVVQDRCLLVDHQMYGIKKKR